MDITIHLCHLTLAFWDSLGAIGASVNHHGFYLATNLRSWRVW